LAFQDARSEAGVHVLDIFYALVVEPGVERGFAVLTKAETPSCHVAAQRTPENPEPASAAMARASAKVSLETPSDK